MRQRIADFDPNAKLGVSGLEHNSEFSDGYEMMHKSLK